MGLSMGLWVGLRVLTQLVSPCLRCPVGRRRRQMRLLLALPLPLSLALPLAVDD